jgi:hypothetical protein
MILHGSVAIILALIGSFGLWKASTAASGSSYLIYLLGALMTLVILPVPIYWMATLQRGRYILARDGISLYWGLRHEEIPINKVTWVGSTDQNRMVLAKPVFRLPGAVLGMQKQADGQPVEFIAARDTDLVMIVTSERIFAISPANTADFLATYHKLAEYGSLAPIQAASLYPNFLFARSWADRPARILLLSSTILALGLIIWVSLSIPNHPMTALRLNPDGSAVELVPGIRLLLLPLLNSFFFIADLLLGLFFYRRADTQSLGYLMWASSVLTSLLFIGAVFFILQAT